MCENESLLARADYPNLNICYCSSRRDILFHSNFFPIFNTLHFFFIRIIYLIIESNYKLHFIKNKREKFLYIVINGQVLNLFSKSA